MLRSVDSVRCGLRQNEAMNSSAPSLGGTTKASSTRARIPAWAADVLAVIVVVVAAVVPGPMPPQPHPPQLLMLSMVIVAAVVLIPLRRRWPVPVLAVSLALYTGAAIFSVANTGLGIITVLAAYSVGSRTFRTATLIAGGAATAVVTVLSLTVADFGVIEPRVFQIAAGIAVAAALGDSSRSYREFLQAATERAERAEQTREAEAQQRVAEERLRIAQDLHDTVAHQISVISLNAGVASGALDKNPAKVREALGRIRASSRDVLKEIGDLLRYLRTDDEPIATAPAQLSVGDIDALVQRVREAGLDVTLVQQGEIAKVAPAVGRVVYRVVQEALTNAHKHGADGKCTVSITAEQDRLLVSVINPVSADREQQDRPQQGGLGLVGIRERIASVHGTVHIDSGNDTFVLQVTLPLRREEQ